MENERKNKKNVYNLSSFCSNENWRKKLANFVVKSGRKKEIFPSELFRLCIGFIEVEINLLGHFSLSNEFFAEKLLPRSVVYFSHTQRETVTAEKNYF